MADQEHLKILREGVAVWNQWRRKNYGARPYLSGANLIGAHLNGADLSVTDLSGANLSDANLSDANLCSAILSDADISGADLTVADLRGAILPEANLTGGNLTGGNLCLANLRSANLAGANLTVANLSGANLSGADLSKSNLFRTVFADTDLSEVKGLETVIHAGPSSVGIDTLYKSQGKIPESFLRGAGVPEEIISLLPSIRTGPPIQWHSCFISYSSRDDEFARRLHERMRAAGLRVWFAPEDMKGGQKSIDQIERAIQIHDKLLLVLSDHSILSDWVMTEIRKARAAERKENRQKLFPIRLTDMKTLKEWQCFDSDTGKDLAVEVREYHIPDFSDWKNHDHFEKEFARLLKDLKASAE